MYLVELFINFVDTTTKQNSYFKIFMFSIVTIVSLFLFFLLFKYLIEENFFFRSNIQNK